MDEWNEKNFHHRSDDEKRITLIIFSFVHFEVATKTRMMITISRSTMKNNNHMTKLCVCTCGWTTTTTTSIECDDQSLVLFFCLLDSFVAVIIDYYGTFNGFTAIWLFLFVVVGWNVFFFLLCHIYYHHHCMFWLFCCFGVCFLFVVLCLFTVYMWMEPTRMLQWANNSGVLSIHWKLS